MASCGGGDGPTQPPAPPSAPSPPTNVQVAQAGNGALTISWTGAAEATSFTVYLASQAGVNSSNYGSLPDGQRSQNATSPTTVSDLQAKTYYVVVTASNTGGESGASAEASGTPEVPLSPTADAQLAAGDYTFSSMNLPAGVTLTVTGAVVINVTGDATIEGTITGDCHSITLRVDGDFTLDGLLTNACTAPPVDGGPDLKVVADGVMTIGSAPSAVEAIVSDGNVRLTDSATEDESFEPLFDTEASPPLAPRVSVGPAQQAGGAAGAARRPVRAGRGMSVRVSRNGNWTQDADATAQDGMNAPAKQDMPVCDNTGVIGGTGGTVALASRSGTLTIGNGVTLKAGDGGRGGDCLADSDTDATATAGKGGNGGSVMYGGQMVVFGNNVTLVRGNGGMGGDADAFAGDAQNPCEDGYVATATGGMGGRGGGTGYIIVEPDGMDIQGAAMEDGADGGKGGTGTAIGGNGADCVCGMSDNNGGDGGAGTAVGGMGGDGAKGNIWPLKPTAAKKGEGGDAAAFGGDGGNGADCCDAKLPGGDGGVGGAADATGGQMGSRGKVDTKRGSADAFGGDGGNGGDGLGPGSGGAGGAAIADGDPQDVEQGEQGVDGMLCADLDIWFIYFSSIPDGLITPGSDIPLNTFDHDQTTQTGTVVAHFQTAMEAGETTVQYQKSGAFLGMGPGGMQVDLNGLLPGFPTAIVSALLDIYCFTANCVELVGFYQGEEVARVGSKEWSSGQSHPNCGNSNPTSFCSQNLELPPPPMGVPYYDAFAFEARGFFWMYHWGLIIVDP